MSRYKAYAEYKDSGVEWLAEIPNHWSMTMLKRYCHVTDGSHHSPKIQSDGIPFISVTDVGINKINFEDSKKISEVDYQQLVNEGCRPNPGDVLLTKDGTIGRAVIVANSDPEFVILSSLGLLSPAVELHNYYLYFYLVSGINIDQMNSLIHGSALRRMTISKINELMICIPTILEQEKIANFLDHETAKIDTLIAKQQGLIKLLKEKRQAVISHAVTKGLNPNGPMRDSGVEWLGEVPAHWVVCRLKQLIKSGSSISYGIVQPGDALDDGVPFIQTTNMSQGTFDLTELQKTTGEIARAYPRSKLDGGEVILGIRASIGAAYVVPESLRGANLSRGVARIIPSNHILAHFLVMFFRSDAVERYWGLSKQGSTFSEVSIETVRELSVPVPPVDEQDEIYKFSKGKLEDLDRIVDRAVQQQIFLQERRTALISAAVTGKIDVRDWEPVLLPELEDATA
jgi:type I restriction enzyme S subunit